MTSFGAGVSSSDLEVELFTDGPVHEISRLNEREQKSGEQRKKCDQEDDVTVHLPQGFWLPRSFKLVGLGP